MEMIIFISVFAGLSVFIFLCAVIKKIKSMEQFQTKIRLQHLYEPSVRLAEERKPSAVMTIRDWTSLTFTERILTPVADAIKRFFMRMAPRAIFKTIERQIIVAGKQNVWSVDKVVFAWGTTIAICFLMGLFIFLMSDLMLIQRLVMLLMLTAIGVVLPMSYLRTAIRERQEKIITELPPFLDLLSVSVQAGLSFDASVDRILRRSSGPLMDEFRQMQKDLRLGFVNVQCKCNR